MWLGEQITERGVGNGISMIILSGIVAGLPGALSRTFESVSNGEMQPMFAIALVAIVLGVTGFCGTSSAPSGASRALCQAQVGRRMYAGQSSHLPFKLNMSGVIPRSSPRACCCSRPPWPAFFATGFGHQDELVLQRIQRRSITASHCTCAVRRADPRLHLFTPRWCSTLARPRQPQEVRAFIPGIRPGQQTGE